MYIEIFLRQQFNLIQINLIQIKKENTAYNYYIYYIKLYMYSQLYLKIQI